MADDMIDIKKLLEKVETRLSEPSFLKNQGLSNEVGIHVFCYNPKDEELVAHCFKKLAEDTTKPFHLIECDLYKIFLDICDGKGITNKIKDIEEKKGSDFILAQLQKTASPQAFVERMKYEPHRAGDILLITGVGKVYPFMRSHIILDNIQHLFADIPVLMLYPGVYNGLDLELFGKFLDGHYYRAFNLL